MHDGGLIEDGLGDARFARNEDEDGGGNGSGLDGRKDRGGSSAQQRMRAAVTEDAWFDHQQEN